MNSLDTMGNIQVWQSSYLHCSSKYREVHDQEHNNGLLKAHNSEQYVCTHCSILAMICATKLNTRKTDYT